ncbi:MAG TPA: glutamate-5-semialdehyde dehydrogenase [Methanomicrobia archaeon]|nr:glutamate-5-semialdehyde dehydrogenase [Methanomicrobia archaeon]
MAVGKETVGKSGRGIVEKAKMARAAALILANASTAAKDAALSRIAAALDEHRAKLLAANKRDVELASRLVAEGQMSTALLDRLKLTDAKIDEMILSVKDVAKLEDPVGKTLSAIELDTDLELYQVACPIGVIGAIFESRPDVLVQISALCLKTGNAVLLKGGSEARTTNEVLFELVAEAASSGEGGVPDGWVHLLETREDVDAMLKLHEYIDLIVPRGSDQFVRYIQDHSSIMVLGHSEGICHVYVDRDADVPRALEICYDAKVQYPAVCNAAETLLVDAQIAGEFLPRMVERYRVAGVEVRGCPRTLDLLERKGTVGIKPATNDDWRTEYNDLIISVRIVDGVDEAIAHINTYGSGHTDAIVTENRATALKFLRFVDSSSVMQNASTRFSDGFRYGKGAEVGISTYKVHARGPVGLEGLMIYKYLVMGAGQVVATYVGRDAKPFTHRKLTRSFSF